MTRAFRRFVLIAALATIAVPSGRAQQNPAVEHAKRVLDLLKQDKFDDVAKEFGVKAWNLRDWKSQYGLGAKPVDAPMPQTAEEMSREIRQLRKELARITMQRDILKKTMGILSED